MIGALPGLPETLVGGLASFVAACTIPLLPAFLALAVAAGDRLLPAVLAYCGAVVVHLVVLGVGSQSIYNTLHSRHGLPGAFGAVLLCVVAVALFIASRRAWLPVGAGIAAGLVAGAVWTPCVGPTLARLLNPTGSATARGLLLVVYGIGLSLPFVLLALVALSWSRVASWLKARRTLLARAGALAFAVLAVAIATGWYRTWASALARTVGPGT